MYVKGIWLWIIDATNIISHINDIIVDMYIITGACWWFWNDYSVDRFKKKWH